MSLSTANLDPNQVAKEEHKSAGRKVKMVL